MHKYKIFIFLVPVLFLLSSCATSPKKPTQTKNKYGVFKSVNGGIKWSEKNAILSTGKALSLRNTSVSLLKIDPKDSQTLYYAPLGLGLYYSYDGAESWQKARTLPKATIRSLAIDPIDNNIVYATIGNKIYQTKNSNRSWQKIYFDTNTKTTIDSIAVNPFNNREIFAGLSRGDLLKSKNQGESWQTVYRFSQKILQIVPDPNRENALYVVLSKKGIYQSLDGGETWLAWNQMLKLNKLSYNVKNLIFFKNDPQTIFLATSYGILKSSDNGENWTKLKLIPPDKYSGINYLSVNPKDYKKIFYITKKALYRSVDGGENWTPEDLPSSGGGYVVLIDQNNPKNMYMSFKKPIKK